MNKESLPGLGSGALREALEQRIKECRETAERWETESRNVRIDRAIHKDYSLTLNALANLLERALSLSSPIEPPPTHELLVGGVVRAALELAILRGDLRMDSGDAFEEMSESEREDVITDTWNAMNGEGTCDDEPVKELTAIYAAFARPTPQASSEIRERVQAILDKWDDGKNNYRGRVILLELKAALAPSRQGAGGK